MTLVETRTRKGQQQEAMPAVEAALGAKITQGNSTRAFRGELLTALTDAYREAHANPETELTSMPRPLEPAHAALDHPQDAVLRA